jgi:hypothetical protein
VKEKGNRVEDEQREKKEEWFSPRAYAQYGKTAGIYL